MSAGISSSALPLTGPFGFRNSSGFCDTGELGCSDCLSVAPWLGGVWLACDQADCGAAVIRKENKTITLTKRKKPPRAACCKLYLEPAAALMFRKTVSAARCQFNASVLVHAKEGRRSGVGY